MQALAQTLRHDWSRLCESGSDLTPVSSSGRIGLENLGNTCYMNATLQLLASVEPWAHPLVAAAPALLGTAPREEAGGTGGVRDDLISQTAVLLSALHSNRYAATVTTLTTSSSAAGDMSDSPSAPKSVEPPPGGPSGYVIPTILRRILGKGSFLHLAQQCQTQRKNTYPPQHAHGKTTPTFRPPGVFFLTTAGCPGIHSVALHALLPE